MATLAQGLHNMQVKVHSLVTSNNAEGTKDILEEGVLRELLAAVDLEYLLDRTGMHAAVNWHDTLSLGAQPPLCLLACASCRCHIFASCIPQVHDAVARHILGTAWHESCRRCCHTTSQHALCW